MADMRCESVAAIDRALTMQVSQRTATRTAIARKVDEINRAEADILSHERVLLNIDDAIEALFEERGRSIATLEATADALVTP